MQSKYAFIKANWHGEIVNKALEGFYSIIPRQQVDVVDVPGAFEMPLVAKDLANTKNYKAIIASAFVVDGGIYRHEFVAESVVQGLMQVSLQTDTPILSVSLTPHQYQDTDYHNKIFQNHFSEKGKEAANTALMIVKTRDSIHQ